MKRTSIPKAAVLVTGLAAALVVATIHPMPAQATPRASSCAGCHNPATPGVTTASPSTATPAPSATYTVAITLVANPNGGNTGYGIVPIAPATEKTFGGNTSAALSCTATMTAPAAAGTYSYTVWTNQGPTDGSAQVGNAVYSITVAAAPVVVTTTTALAVSPVSPVVAPANPTLTATVTGAGAAGSVEFFNGTTSLGTSPVAAGLATKALTGIAAGSYSYSAKLIPTSATAFSPSTSSVVTYVVTVPVPAPVPTASFTASATSGIFSLPVTMTDTSTGIPTSWTWDLGDGTTSTVQNPSVTYTAAGTYTVTLTATNASGASTPVSRTITVTDTVPTPSTAHISWLSTDEGYVGSKVTIRGTGFGAAGVVKFGTVVARVSLWTSTSIVVSVPSGISREEVDVTVTPLGGSVSNGVEFEVNGRHYDDSRQGSID